MYFLKYYYIISVAVIEEVKMQKFIKLVLVVLLVTSCSKSKKVKYDDLAIVNGDNVKVEYKVELAQTHDEMETGLMNRDSLKANSGMLFALGAVEVPTAMWMKDTKIPLDMIFIDKDGDVYWIYENAEPNSEKLIVPPYQAFAVLEINAGDVKKYGITLGDHIKHSWFKQKNPFQPDSGASLD